MKLQVTETFERTVEVYYQKKIMEIGSNRLTSNEYKFRQIVSMGGSRSSKTFSILQILMLEMIHRKNIKITVWRNTKVTCRATVMEDFQNIIMFNDAIYRDFKENKQSGTFTYMPTGSRIVFEGADSVGKVLGGAQTISYFNEVTEFSKEVYLQITQRTSDRVICDYNPSKDFWLELYRYDADTVFIHSTFKNNAYCPPNIVKQLLSYEPWETGSYKIVGSEVHYRGHVITRENQPPPHIENVKKGTANEFMWLVYGLGLGSEKPNRIYRGWKVISQEEFDKLPYISYFGLDFGGSNPTACVEVKYDGNGTFYICPRFYKPLSDIDKSIVTALKTEIPQIKVGSSMVICDSAKQMYIDILREAGYLAMGAIKGSGSIESGISLVQSYEIHYVRTPAFEKEYTNYSWHIDRYGKSTDLPIKLDDHYLDAVRYVITYLTWFLNIKV